MNSTRAEEQKSKQQLASQFNDFYVKLNSETIRYISNYEIIKKIGEGSYGQVYLAKHLLLNVNVVLKCGLIDDPNIVREIYYQKQLNHKNIVKLYEIIKTEKHIWLVMEYCEGNELFYHIYEKQRLDFKECQNLFFQIVQGLRHVHSLNLSHRDLKLENILLADKKKTIVKLSDFGFVREYKRLFLSTICGTTVYMAPELLKNEKYSGFCIDIWSLGIILYTMFYGEMPFDEDDELRTKYKIINEEPLYRDSIPQDVINLIKKMLSKDPNKRPSLNDILNSPFLIDLMNKEDTTKKSDVESIISINQHYRECSAPFQSKVERNLLKKLQKLNINVSRLQADVTSGEMNPTTAFYELSLKKEYSKKKRKYYNAKKSKYKDARKSLRRSTSKMRSALSLNETQPLERIMSSLSISSRAGGNKTGSTQAPVEQPDENVLQRRSTSGTKTVVFSDDRGRLPSISSMFSTNSERIKRNNKNKTILNKLQFWRKNKLASGTLTNGSFNNVLNKLSSGDYNDEDAPLEININKRPHIPDREITNNLKINDSNDPSSSTRQRPLSMMSQASQNSHLSQVSSTLMSELELEDILDESDTLDDDFDDDMSISTSQDRHHSIRGSRNRRTYSDISIKSTSTNNTQQRKRPSLSQLSSNSSEEKVLVINGLLSPSPKSANTPTEVLPSPTIGRGNSPDFSKTNRFWKYNYGDSNKARYDTTYRPHSPPIPLRSMKDRKFGKVMKPVSERPWVLNDNINEADEDEETVSNENSRGNAVEINIDHSNNI